MTSPESTPSPRQLRRSSSDRRIVGVAGGLSAHYGLDPTLVRIAFVILSFVGGIGLAAYAVAGFVMPAEPGAPPMVPAAKASLVVIAIAAVCSIPFAGGSAVLLVVPAAVAILVWRFFGGRVDPRLVRASGIVVGLAAAIVIGLGAGLATAFGGGTVVAILVIAAGLGLIAAGVVGGARWLILPALILAVPATVVQAADLNLEGGVGDRQYRPASVTELRSVYRLGAGDLRVDLRDLHLEPGAPVDVTVRVGAGRANVIVPRGVCVQTTGHAGIGAVDILGRTNEGVDVDAERGGLAKAGQPIVRLHLKAGVGELQVGHRVTDGEYGPRVGTGCAG